MKKARNQISKSQRKDTILQICKLAQLQIWANIRNRIKTSFVPYKISSCWLRIAIAAAATFIHTCAHNCTQETENTKMSDAAHRLLDNLVNDLKTKLLAKTHDVLRTSPPPPSLSLLSESISPILLFSRLFSALRSRISSSFWSALTDETDV